MFYSYQCGTIFNTRPSFESTQRAARILAREYGDSVLIRDMLGYPVARVYPDGKVARVEVTS